MSWASLADGQLASATADLYVATAPVSISSIMLTNTHTGNVTRNVYILRSGSADRRIAGKDVNLLAGQGEELCADAQAIRLSAGDKIRGDASTAAKVDYVICGVTA